MVKDGKVFRLMVIGYEVGSSDGVTDDQKGKILEAPTITEKVTQPTKGPEPTLKRERTLDELADGQAPVPKKSKKNKKHSHDQGGSDDASTTADEGSNYSGTWWGWRSYPARGNWRY